MLKKQQLIFLFYPLLFLSMNSLNFDKILSPVYGFFLSKLKWIYA